jgi:hypothetical protein
MQHPRFMYRWIIIAALGIGGQAWATTGQPVSIDQVPEATRDTIEAQAKSRPLLSLKRHEADGSVHYDAKFKTTTEGVVQLSVDDKGRVMQRVNRTNERNGDGP